jgi:hypothetical protein
VAGHVLAYCNRRNITYFIPMEILFKDIKKTLGTQNVQIPNSVSIDSLRALGVHANSVPKATAAGKWRENDRRELDKTTKSKRSIPIPIPPPSRKPSSVTQPKRPHHPPPPPPPVSLLHTKPRDEQQGSSPRRVSLSTITNSTTGSAGQGRYSSDLSSENMVQEKVLSEKMANMEVEESPIESPSPTIDIVSPSTTTTTTASTKNLVDVTETGGVVAGVEVRVL